MFYLPFSGPSMKSGVHTEEKSKGQSPDYILKFSKKTMFNEHPVSYQIGSYWQVIDTIGDLRLEA